MAVMTRRSIIESVPRSEYVPTADQRIVMSGVSWDAFETFLTLRGAGRWSPIWKDPRLMSPSLSRAIKTRFAEVVQAYLGHVGITYEVSGRGS
jgi:hypothetical protein